MKIFIRALLYLVTLPFALQAQELHLSFNGESWWKEFAAQHEVQLYNAPYSLTDEKPHFLWKNIGQGGSLLFDGYSTYMELQDFRLPETFELSFWLAPRAFDSAVDNKLSAIVDYTSVTDSLGFKVGLLKHGQLALQFQSSLGKKRFTNDSLFVKKNEWNFIQISYNGKSIQIARNGEQVLEESLDIKDLEDSFTATDYQLTIGRNSNASGFGRKFKFNMISGLLDELNIRQWTAGNSLAGYKPRSVDGLVESLRLDYSKLKDGFRPGYHAMAPAHWMNEPHAPIYYKGKYHLFYQHNPFGPYWGQIHWGHWVSDDMVYWKHADIALAPEKGDVDPDGIWSGSAYVGPDDTPYLFYTAGNDNKHENQYVSTAYPRDKDDRNLIQWDKTGLIVDKPAMYLHREFRDPYVFKVDDMYYMMVGTGIAEKGGTAALFESSNMRSWKHLHPVYISDIEKYPFLGGVWELPVLLPLPDSSGNKTDKYVFMVLPIRNEADVEVFYWIGEFDKNSKKFVPDDDEPRLMDYGNFGFTGPSGLVDPKTNRSIVFSIAQGKYGRTDTFDMGWAHNAGLPINLWLGDDGALQFAPIEELKDLRMEPTIDCENCTYSAIKDSLIKVRGSQFEIELEFTKENIKRGIIVRQSKDKNPQAMVYYEPETNSVVFDKIQEQPERRFEALKAPLAKDGEKIKLHIFLDRSMIEIYVDERTSITDRIYFTEDDAQGIELMGFELQDNIDQLSIWPMKSIEWQYAEPTNNKSRD
ncbi:GH32 C-terminal domain-containing protein [Flagellimonas baculiformis]|uniref:GH32 C-terminal domain-containing protein n=1 Tax=Flagellimonas baculiformis TaxID=3067310 RepID=UPI00296EFF03|nr:GH32 C-terminal domain-containing protein [Muricauda sp. D6]